MLGLVRRWMVRNTHHWIAFNAVEGLEERWRNVFLKHIEDVLGGSKDPDKRLGDWENHVFHPPSWGGAPSATARTYSELVGAL